MCLPTRRSLHRRPRPKVILTQRLQEICQTNTNTAQNQRCDDCRRVQQRFDNLQLLCEYIVNKYIM